MRKQGFTGKLSPIAGNDVTNLITVVRHCDVTVYVHRGGEMQ